MSIELTTFRLTGRSSIVAVVHGQITRLEEIPGSAPRTRIFFSGGDSVDVDCTLQDAAFKLATGKTP